MEDFAAHLKLVAILTQHLVTGFPPIHVSVFSYTFIDHAREFTEVCGMSAELSNSIQSVHAIHVNRLPVMTIPPRKRFANGAQFPKTGPRNVARGSGRRGTVSRRSGFSRSPR